MKISRTLALWGITLALAGCRRDFCSDVMTWKPQGSCDLGKAGAVSGLFSPPLSPLDNETLKKALDVCRTFVKRCTVDDVDQLNSLVDCADRVPACLPGLETAYVKSLSQCFQKQLSLSSACGT